MADFQEIVQAYNRRNNLKCTNVPLTTWSEVIKLLAELRIAQKSNAVALLDEPSSSTDIDRGVLIIEKERIDIEITRLNKFEAELWPKEAIARTWKLFEHTNTMTDLCLCWRYCLLHIHPNLFTIMDWYFTGFAVLTGIYLLYTELSLIYFYPMVLTMILGILRLLIAAPIFIIIAFVGIIYCYVLVVHIMPFWTTIHGALHIFHVIGKMQIVGQKNLFIDENRRRIFCTARHLVDQSCQEIDSCLKA
jgi:hypothetical protein